jgi:hypothetical protein
MMLDKGRHGREQILSRATVELMTSDHLTPEQRAGSEIFFGDHSSWGFGMAVSVPALTRIGQLHANGPARVPTVVLGVTTRLTCARNGSDADGSDIETASQAKHTIMISKARCRKAQ